jgi:tetratricopeptide (TPR) repeat protein
MYLYFCAPVKLFDMEKLPIRFHGIFLIAVMCALPIFVKAQTDYAVFDEGVSKFKSKDYKAVIDDFTTLVSKPEHNKKLDEDIFYYRGQSYYFTGEYEKSLSDLQESLKLNHFNTGIIHWYMGRCYDKLGKASDATSEYKEAAPLLEKNKKIYPEFLADRAQFYARHGDSALAQEDIALASSLDPKYKTAKLEAGETKKTRTAGEEKSSPQVIVTSKPKKEEGIAKQDNVSKAKADPVQTQAVQQVQPTKTLPVSLGEMYKDEKRYALVIGNSTYAKEIGVLKNPANDATDIAQELRGANFDVQLLINATYIQIREAVRKFHEKLTNGPVDQTVGLFYYAGHGIQFQDENYLVPVDAKVQFEDDIVRMCFPVQRMVLSNMERSNSRMNIVILDACRNNPFPAATRSAGSGGLTEMKRARGSFIAYATAPGSVAADGSGRNGLYTQELLKAMRKPGLTIEQVFKDVRQNVLRLSGDNQNTWDSSNIIGEFYFKFQP